MNQEVDTKLAQLECQINDLLWQVSFEEQKENPDINTLNWLIKRIFRSSSTVNVIKNNKQYHNDEQMALAIDEKYVEYLYAFGQNLPKAVVKIEKLNYTAATTTTTTSTTTTTTTINK